MALPPRPRFRGLLRPRSHRARYARVPLRDLDYVVFDTETTGLEPEYGDRVVQIGAVRISGGETGAIFDHLVNPQRAIPPRSTRFHGITDDMVQDAPTLESLMPVFQAFVGEAVLVGQNAAFDLAFLRPVQKRVRAHMDNVVLDTMLLSMFLSGFEGDHSLDALAERHGVDVEGRHTALGDARVTGAVFFRQLDQLATRGVTTLGGAVKAMRRLGHLPGVRRLR